jgi:hypothetical protein
MLDATLGIVINVIVLGVIGLGPSLLLLSAKTRSETAIAIAPTLGFCILGILATWLIILDRPVASWDRLCVAVTLGIGAVLALIAIQVHVIRLKDLWGHSVILLCVGGIVTLILVASPMLIGGSDFTVLRGNGTDTFNYLTLAGYLQREPYSWASQVDTKTLINRHPSYAMAKQLLQNRWTTSAMLALSAKIASVPIYRFEYAYTLLFFVIAFGPAFCLGRMMKLSLPHAFVLALAICVGFWAQLVLDIRAMSQMNSMPVLLVIGVLITRIESYPRSYAIGEASLLLLSITGLILFYVEIIPTLILALTILAVITMVHGQNDTRRMLKYAVIVLAALLLTSPLVHLLSFLQSQLIYAASGSNDWHKVYFSWLYGNPLIGIWGLSHFSRGLGVALMTVLGTVLTVLMIYEIGRCLRGKSSTATMVAVAFVLAAFVQFVFLLIGGQLWAAGKAISFVYPFMMALAVPVALPVRNDVPKALIRASTYVIVGWLGTQLVLSAYRIGIAYTETDYDRYIGNHGLYRKHDWNLTAIDSAIETIRPASIFVSVSEPWLAEYVGFAIGGRAKLYLDGRDRNGAVVRLQPIAEWPQYLIVNRDPWLNGACRFSVIAKNTELSLVKLSNEGCKDATSLPCTGETTSLMGTTQHCTAN